MIALSNLELTALFGLPAPAHKFAASGIAHTPQSVRGGELYLPLQEADAQEQVLAQTFERGAALALVEKSVALPNQDAERCIQVTSLSMASQRIAVWWAKRFDLCFVLGDYAATTVKDMLAAVLLARGRGAYAQESGLPLANALCQISAAHEWAVFEAEKVHELVGLGALEPKLLLVTGMTPGPQETEQAVHKRTLSLLQDLSSAFPGTKILVNGADRFIAGALPHFAFAKLYTYGLGGAVTFGVSEVTAYGLDGVEGEFRSPNGSSAFTVKVPGEHQALNATAALGGALLLFPEQPLEKWVDELPRFTAPRFKMRFVPLKNFRRLLNELGRGDLASFAASFKLCAALKADDLRVALVLGEIGAQPSLRGAFWQEQAPFIKSLAPTGVLLIGAQAGEQFSFFQTQGMSPQTESSPEALAQLARTLDFDILLLKGVDTPELRKVAEVLLERESQFSP